jgi:hypothetical protein
LLTRQLTRQSPRSSAVAPHPPRAPQPVKPRQTRRARHAVPGRTGKGESPGQEGRAARGHRGRAQALAEARLLQQVGKQVPQVNACVPQPPGFGGKPASRRASPVPHRPALDQCPPQATTAIPSPCLRSHPLELVV